MLVKRPPHPYTSRMTSIVLVLGALFGQQSESPWMISLKADDGTRRIVAYCDESDFDKDIFTVSEEKPWAGPRTTRTIRKKDVLGRYRPVKAELEAYFAEGWKANGGIQIDTPHGKRWVFEEEYKLAQRAAEMARANEAEKAVEIVPTEISETNSTEPAERTFSFGQLWGAHVAVLSLGLGLSGLVTWFLIIE